MGPPQPWGEQLALKHKLRGSKKAVFWAGVFLRRPSRSTKKGGFQSGGRRKVCPRSLNFLLPSAFNIKKAQKGQYK